MIYSKMAQFNIIFENLNKFFFEGEKIRLKLEVTVDETCIVHNIVANFVGVSSYSSKDDKFDMAAKLFSKSPREIHFDDVLPLYVAQKSEAPAWSPKTQCYSFEYQLPHSLPSSIEFEQGYVRYTIHVVAEIDEQVIKKSDHFTVVSKANLSKDMRSLMPGVKWSPEHQCCVASLFLQGSVRAFLHIPKQGYVPGEHLFINAEIFNYHRLPIEWVKATLFQIIKIKGSKVNYKRIVSELTRGCILPSETQTWRSESILIPAVPPSTTLTQERLIHVKYRLSFQYKASWQIKTTELKQKIIIGTVKLIDCGEGEEQGQGDEGIYNSEFFNGSNLEPCIYGPHWIEEDEKSSTFSPLYPIAY